jgi:hypothetical protein
MSSLQPAGGEQGKKRAKKKNRGAVNKVQKTEKPAPAVSDYTISVALPGSIVANAQTAELKTYLAGQIARALVIFNVDEVIIYQDRRQPGSVSKSTDGAFQGAIKVPRLHHHPQPRYQSCDA